MGLDSRAPRLIDRLSVDRRLNAAIKAVSYIMQVRSVRVQLSGAARPRTYAPCRKRTVFLRSPVLHRAPLIRRRALENETELDAEAEKFMKKQAELESGDTSVPVLEEAVGTDAVPDDLARKYCKDIVEAVRDLEKLRDMTFGEIKLTVAIDPRMREQQPIGSESETDVSRAEIANALVEVVDGKIPNDRIALKVLWEEMVNWPALDMDRQNQKEKTDDTKKAGWREGQARPPVGRDASERPVSLEDMLPEWVGYSYLYLLSAVPLIIGVVVVAILFINSLQ